MTRRLVRILALALAVSVGWGGAAFAAPMEPINDPWSPRDEFELVCPGDLLADWTSASGPTCVGVSFIEPGGSSSSLMGFAPDPDRPGEMSGGACSSWNSPPCDQATLIVASGSLPACSPAHPSDCIEEFYAKVDGNALAANFLEAYPTDPAPPYDSIPVTNGPAVPGSGLPPLWDLPGLPHDGGSTYLTYATVTSVLTRPNATSDWTRSRSELSTDVYAVTKGGAGHGGDCAHGLVSNFRTGECLIEKRLPDAPLGLRMKVGADFGQFVFGRVQEPSIDITSASTGIVLDVEGKPAATPQAAAALPFDQAPDFIDRSGSFYPGLNYERILAGASGSLDHWRQWSPYVGSRSDAVVRIWSFHSANTWFASDSRCLPTGQVGGWISTNAMVFEASPPVFDPGAGVMDFKLGGPALTPTGGSASADYDFFLRKSVSDCLWPDRNLGAVATVSVIDGGTGDEVTSTAVAVSDEWVKFTARNVLFPEAPPLVPASRATQQARVLGTTPTIRVSVTPRDQPRTFANCKEMRQVYRDGVAAPKAVNVIIVKGKKVRKPALGKPYVSASLYSAHMRLDVDRDRLVCEREPRAR